MKHIYVSQYLDRPHTFTQTLTQREKDMRPSVIDYATIKAEALANTEMRDESKTTETEALADRQVGIDLSQTTPMYYRSNAALWE